VFDVRPTTDAPLVLDDDRLFPTGETERAIARELFAQVRGLPLVSPHGHVEAEVFADDVPFPDPARLFVTPDHYVTRMLHSQGVRLEELGVPRKDGAAVETDGRAIWRLLCSNWHLYRGTPSRLWLEQELVELFDVRVRPSAETADELYDLVAERLATPGFRPRALYERFGLEVLATTDSPLATLEHHRRLREDPGWRGRIVPTFRPDALVEVRSSGWADRVSQLGALTNADPTTYRGFIAALEERRAAFKEMGATATDHGHLTADSAELSAEQAEDVFQRALAGQASAADADAFRAHMLGQFARMSCDDGLVMQLHPGVHRNYDSEVFRAFGPDVGFDIPTATDYARALHPLLNRYGTHPGFAMVLFTVDETQFSRQIAPLAGVYPSVRIGAPWWFLDAPHAMRRFREATVETAGLYNTAGFVDDTRALCSIPARHDVARRIDCGFLAGLVAQGLLAEDEAAQTAVDLTYTLPKLAFRLDQQEPAAVGG
jgi:glucuronate isomerase